MPNQPLDGKLDDPGVPIIDTELGESLTGVRVDVDSLVVFRLQLEAGQSFAAVMRAEDDLLDAYLLLKGPDGSTLRTRDDQTALPMASETDSVLVWTAQQPGTHFVFAAGGADLDTAGTFRFDLIELAEAPAAAIDETGPAERAIADELRRLEPDVDDFMAAGALVEGADGLLDRDTDGFKQLPLVERAELNRVQAAVNSAREQLFEFLPAPTSFAELWTAVRAL